MIDHIYLPVTDLKRSDSFYSNILGQLGYSERWHFKAQAGYPDLTGFGEPGIPGFWLKASKTTCVELYVAFTAKNEAAVNKAYEAALANGGKDNGAPGLRPQFDPRYYAANVLDPDGYNVEICYKPFTNNVCAAHAPSAKVVRTFSSVTSGDVLTDARP